MRLELKATTEQKGDEAVETGCAVVFTSFPALSGTYGMDRTTLDEIGAVARDAGAGLGLPFGADYFVYPTKTNVPQMFDAEQIQALYQVLRDYTASVRYYRAGQVPSLPPQPVVIP